MTSGPRKRPRELCARYAAAGDPLGWFEALYREARRGEAVVPWADLVPNPHLREWQRRTGYDVRDRRCLVVGCGLGDDAEHLAAAGGSVVAFDIAPTAIEWCRSRFPSSRVEYVQADVIAPPPDWHRGFDFVVESYTLQVLPGELRRRALTQLASVLAPSGTLLVVCRGREASDPVGDLPWPLVREELQGLGDLHLVRWEEYLDAEDPPVLRFRAEFRRVG